MEVKKKTPPTPYVRKLRLHWTLIIVSLPFFVGSSFILYKRVILGHDKRIIQKEPTLETLIGNENSQVEKTKE
ncbi:hypothetical protein Glove_82g86 [Diversispora epigaea]|uniref:Uncharacterized protein n=1 Tax=Diversispora epigaea TaxID=1348612 RepID=A0A397JIL6_9GLOM|nr:hypothetical protein Glove_82g86 [Diversispora epigaea]